MRKTKIIATLGPACSDSETILELIEAGADGFRINFSHGTRESRTQLVEEAQTAIEQSRKEITLIQDLRGPRLRTGTIEEEPPLLLEDGETIKFGQGDTCTSEQLKTDYEHFLEDVNPGHRILIDEGFIRLEAQEHHDDYIECRIIRGGVLRDHMGMNLPDSDLSIPTLTEKDIEDIKHGKELGFDCVMQSFVREVEDVIALEELLEDWDNDPLLIAKIETKKAVERLAEFARKVDVFLVARGDLGAELSLKEVPWAQKRILQIAHEHDVGSITATQMLESMVHSPLPTRAEISDISNAILDGTGAVMLSEETAIGEYPVQTVEEMAKVCKQTETKLFPYSSDRWKIMGWKPSIQASVRGGVGMANDVNADAIGVFTRTGLTACLVSFLRPQARILTFSDDPALRKSLKIRWGIHPIPIEFPGNLQELIPRAEKQAIKHEALEPGERIVFISGTKKATGEENFVTIREVTVPRQTKTIKIDRERIKQNNNQSNETDE